MYDIIGKRRWLYLFSLIITIPGLVLILLTPFTDLGLQFSIDYTGGTRWVIRFDDRNVTPDQVRQVFDENGLAASVIQESDGYLEIRTEQVVGLREAPAPSLAPSAGPSAAPSGSASPGQPGASARLASPVHIRVTRSLRVTRCLRIAVPDPARGQHRDPDRRATRCDRHDPPGPLRPDREPDRPHVDRRSREQ